MSISDLKAKGREAQLALLLHNKKSLLEGMVFEAILDRKFFAATPGDLAAIPCQAMVASVRGKPTVFIWFTAETPHRVTLLEKLAVGYDVREVVFDPTKQDFFVVGHEAALLTDCLAKATGVRPSITLREIPDADRLGQKAVTYGHLQFATFESAILPRILKDFRIEPYCSQCWDLDRFFAYRGQIWSLEVKHKYPTYRGDFGLNKGQVGEIVHLTSCGINYLHLVFVKPCWNSRRSPMEFLLDQGMAAKIGIIGCTFDNAAAVALMNSPDKLAPEKTSLTGTRKQPYKVLRVGRFYSIGLYSEDAAKIWPRILKLIEGHPAGEPMTLKRLEGLRVEDRLPAK